MFEEMCNMPLKEDMILFETGTYSFTGKPMFNFSLVRQFPNDEEDIILHTIKVIKMRQLKKVIIYILMELDILKHRN